jgi:DNA invertase Pin-like site-specific DNA recombinase
VRLLGYVRTLAWGPATETEPGPQEDAIRAWTHERGHTLVDLIHEDLVPGKEGLEDRLRLAKAFDMLRWGTAEAIVVSRLDRLADDIVLQERLLAEIRAQGATTLSADPDDESALEAPEGARAAIRQVLATSAEYERSKRELHIKREVARSGMPRDRHQAAMATIEALAGEGASIDEITARLRAEGFTPRSGHLFSRPRLRRILAERSRSRIP